MVNGWQFFEETGNIEAYLLYLEYKRLLDGEYAEEFMEAEKGMMHERENAGVDSKGSQHR